MRDVAVLEAAHHVRDRVDLADVGEELVAEAFAFRCAAHQTGDIDEGQPGRNDLVAAGDPRQRVEPQVGNADVADVGLDGAEGIVRRLRRRGLGEGVEQGGLADVGQPDDAAAKSHQSSAPSRVSRLSSGLRARWILFWKLAAWPVARRAACSPIASSIGTTHAASALAKSPSTWR